MNNINFQGYFLNALINKVLYCIFSPHVHLFAYVCLYGITNCTWMTEWASLLWFGNSLQVSCLSGLSIILYPLLSIFCLHYREQEQRSCLFPQPWSVLWPWLASFSSVWHLIGSSWPRADPIVPDSWFQVPDVPDHSSWVQRWEPEMAISPWAWADQCSNTF